MPRPSRPAPRPDRPSIVARSGTGLTLASNETGRPCTRTCRRLLDHRGTRHRCRPAASPPVGQAADLLLLDADPLKEITNTRRIAGVMMGQRWMARADLDAMLAEPVP